MKILVFLFCIAVFRDAIWALDLDFGDDDEEPYSLLHKKLPGHEVTQKPLIGRPDGHEQQREPLIGRPDGHEQQREPLIGRPDGHEREFDTKKPLIGRPDGHEPTQEPLIGRPDGHEPTQEPLIGRPDGHEPTPEPLFGRPDGHEREFDSEDSEEPLVRCKRPMCSFEMQCALGMQTDASGCPICKCLEDPCLGINCYTGFSCRAIECSDSHSCIKLTAKCRPSTAASTPICTGPEPMCANFCPDGYKKNSRGCMTCSCNDPPQPKMDILVCGTEVCEMGQICRSGVKAFDNTELAPFCAPKPLCHMAQEMAGMMRGSSKNGHGAGMMMSPRIFVPDCQEDGTFSPLQCHLMKAECWCVDDRGVEIDGTRTTVFVEEHKPHCLVNSTVALHMSMSFIVWEEDDVSEIGELDSIVGEHISSWMLIDKQYVKVLEAQPQNQADLSDKNTVIVKLMVFHNSISDLPSAAEYMKRKMRMGECRIPFGGKTLKLDSDSLQIEHKFTYQTVRKPLPVEDDDVYVEQKMWYNCRNFQLFKAPLMLLSLMLVLTLITVFVFWMRRYRRQQYDVVQNQFKHRQLENQLSTTTDKSFYLKDNHQNESVVLVTADTLDENKLPLA